MHYGLYAAETKQITRSHFDLHYSMNVNDMKICTLRYNLKLLLNLLQIKTS